jgi:hypothetical protein
LESNMNVFFIKVTMYRDCQQVLCFFPSWELYDSHFFEYVLRLSFIAEPSKWEHCTTSVLDHAFCQLNSTFRFFVAAGFITIILGERAVLSVHGVVIITTKSDWLRCAALLISWLFRLGIRHMLSFIHSERWTYRAIVLLLCNVKRREKGFIAL